MKKEKKHKRKKVIMPGAKIRAARLSEGTSQMKLAEKIGISYQQLQKYENGTSELTISRLRQFSEALNLPLSYFLDDIHNLEVSEDIISYNALNKDEVKVIQLLRRINNKKFTQKLIETLRSIITPKK